MIYIYIYIIYLYKYTRFISLVARNGSDGVHSWPCLTAFHRWWVCTDADQRGQCHSDAAPPSGILSNPPPTRNESHTLGLWLVPLWRQQHPSLQERGNSIGCTYFRRIAVDWRRIRDSLSSFTQHSGSVAQGVRHLSLWDMAWRVSNRMKSSLIQVHIYLPWCWPRANLK